MRRVGVEIEFANLSARDAAAMLQKLFGGRIREVNPHRFELEDARFGSYRLEIDTRFAHAGNADNAEGLVDPDVSRTLREWVGDIASYVVPCEIVTPPVAMDCLVEMQRIVDALRRAGARGTGDSVFYGFGLQLNIEAAELRVAYIVRMLRAYLLLADWLRANIQLDALRRILGFADPFPDRYVAHVLDPAYDPDIDALIDDYLHFNPTRNRDLDLLPLLAHLRRERIAHMPGGKEVKPRPAFHYRLPGSRIDDPGWTINAEWDRWLRVENLAEDERRLTRMSEAYLVNMAALFPRDWVTETERWLVD